MPENRLPIKTKRFNFIDFILCVVAVAVIALGVWAVVGDRPAAGGEETPVNIVIEFEKVDNEIAGGIAPGDVVSVLETKTELGTVKTVAVTPETYVFVDGPATEGELVTLSTAKSTLLSKLSVTVTANASVTSQSVSVNGYRILCGDSVKVYGKSFAGEGKIIAIFR